MTMRKIMQSLRRKNGGQYTILMFSITLSVLLVTSFSLMYYSPTVQEVLPEGGDSRKQADLILAVAVIGCTIFSTYAAGIFLKYKSRQFGIFLALGEKKRHLKQSLRKELSLIAGGCCLAGLILSLPASYGLWKIFQLFLVNTDEMKYRLGISGLIFGIIFCVVVALCIFVASAKFIKRTNIIEIIQEQRKTEIIKEIKPWTGKVGILLIFVGLVGGYGIPMFSAYQFQTNLPAVWNLVYLLAAVGLYMFMLNVIVKSKKGKNPKRYYKNIISVNLMRFTGRQTVRNMCVIAFLIIASLYACFYVPSQITTSIEGEKNNPVDYMFYYPQSEDQIEKREIYQLAEEYKVKITSYKEAEMITLITGGQVTELTDDGKYESAYVDKIQYASFISEKQYNKLTGKDIRVGEGTYKTITIPGAKETVWSNFDDLKKITHPAKGQSKKMQYTGNEEYQPLVTEGNMHYVISDKDYKSFRGELSSEDRENYVLFNVKNQEETYDFASKLKEKIVLNFSQDVAVGNYYDRYEKRVADEKGITYEYQEVELTPDNYQLYLDWKYYPTFKVLNKQDMLPNLAVYLLMFVYITIICLTAVGIIAYTRSLSIGMDNSQLFRDLRKLGANERYVVNVIKRQLAKVFFYPVVAGAAVAFSFDAIVKFMNDRRMSHGELVSIGADLIVIAAVFLIMYGIYRLALKKVKKIAGITKP